MVLGILETSVAGTGLVGLVISTEWMMKTESRRSQILVISTEWVMKLGQEGHRSRSTWHKDIRMISEDIEGSG